MFDDLLLPFAERTALTRLRFGLQSLLAATMVCAIAVTLMNAYHSRSTADISPFSKSDIAKLYPIPKIVGKQGRYRVTLRSRHIPVAEVATNLGLNQLIAHADSHEITFESFEREPLEELIEIWPDGDKRTPLTATKVVGGRVIDQDGQPVVLADVQLQSNDQSLVKGITRADGTFGISFLADGTSNRYRLKIMWQDVSNQHTMTTRAFSFAAGSHEKLVHITIRK